ncbi:MAG TPA: enoyl-CoA hydratase [Solirubrobacteraceae bacterium]|nr:enoyl-CoA hydratase [Solirubrobacteraceae bacterium]
MSDTMLFEVQDDVAVLTFNRPDRLNAWVPEMQTRYFDLLAECAARTDVRAIVLTGAGRGFCAGADMQSLEQLAGGNGDGEAVAHDPRPVTYALTIPKPIIAAINGACAGLGLVHALMCDIRFAAAEAKLTTAFARRGLVAEHGISWMLPRLIGPARALDLLLSGRVILGDEAAELGLVNRAVAGERLVEEALDYARMLAREASPVSMAQMKHQVYADLERSLGASLEEANRLMAESFAGPDFGEGVRSFVERRSPNFEPLARTSAELAS